MKSDSSWPGLALLAVFVVDSGEKDLTTASEQDHHQGEEHE
ncbi:hypothetical protein [Bradyrhizobium sp. CCBAU 51765]|nr:hypothetical protein [Bradyrhizobium sp. CCBAU 51765]